MKKILSIALAATMLLSSSAMVLAANETKNTLVKYGVADQYEVSIPAEIDLDENGYGEAELVVGDVFLIPHGSQLEVYVSGHDYTTAWELIDTADATNKLVYTINDTVVNNDKVLSLASGHDVLASPVKETLRFQVTSKLAKSGNYNDTLTFRTTIADTITVETIEFTIANSSNAGPFQAEKNMTWREWANSDYNTAGYRIDQDKFLMLEWGILCADNALIPLGLDEVIIDGHEYWLD